MNEKNKKKLMITGLFVLLLGVGYLNYTLTNPKTPGAEEASVIAEKAKEEAETEDSFEVFKTERTRSRNQQLSYIESVAQSEETDDETKKEAQQMKLMLAENMEKELTAEGLIKTKLSLVSVVAVKEGSASVVVKRTKLSEDEVTQIADIVISETGLAAQNIKIMTANG